MGKGGRRYGSDHESVVTWWVVREVDQLRLIRRYNPVPPPFRESVIAPGYPTVRTGPLTHRPTLKNPNGTLLLPPHHVLQKMSAPPNLESPSAPVRFFYHHPHIQIKYEMKSPCVKIMRIEIEVILR